MQNSARQVVSNLGTVILALLLAFVVWISATLQDDPYTVQEFSNVSVELVGQPEDTIFFEDVAERVTVAARAPQSVLEDLSAGDFRAVLDLSTTAPGTPATLPIEVTTENEAVRIEGWSPAQQSVSLETVINRLVPIDVRVEGQVATGYQSSAVSLIPNQITVTGPAPLVTRVVSMTGSLDVEGAKEDVVEQVALRPVDQEGQLVSGVQWAPDQTQVRVAIRRRLGYKPDVQVVPDLRGDPAVGYRLGSVGVEPSTVTLAGLPSILNELPGFVETLPISVTDATENLFKRTPITVPNSVVVVGLDYVTVTVEVLPIQGSRAITAPVEIQGLSAQRVATASPSEVDAILQGPELALSALTPSDIRVVLDLFEYSSGVHRVAPDVIAPEGVEVVSIIPETIEVVIGMAPTPTPTLTITPTITVEP